MAFAAWPSHPTRGGWIEMNSPESIISLRARPTPHGVGGLKWLGRIILVVEALSHPTRGGWIEILLGKQASYDYQVPPHTGWVD